MRTPQLADGGSHLHLCHGTGNAVSGQLPDATGREQLFSVRREFAYTVTGPEWLAAGEIFLDAAGRTAFDNHAEYLDLYGTERIIPEMDRPRISARRLLPARIRARLGIVSDPAMHFAQRLA